MFGHTLKGFDDVFLRDKAHLTVDLRELRLTVGTKVFVTETFHNLEIAVHTRHHKKLFQCLRRLRKGVELSRIHTRRNDEVTRSLRCRTYEHRGFNLQKSLAVQIAAHFHCHAMAQLQIATHHAATQVQITIFHTQIVSPVRIVLDSKRWRQGGVQDSECVDHDFDFAGRNIFVLVRAFAHDALHLDDKLTAQVVGLLAKRRIFFFIENQLGDAVTVAQVDKGHASHLTCTLHPSSQGHFLPCIGESQLSTCMRSVHCY